MTAIKPSLKDSVHLVPGFSAAGSLRQIGCGEIINLDDSLFPGPCDARAKRHLAKRREFLKSYCVPIADPTCNYWEYFADKLRTSDDVVKLLAKTNKPIVIWTSRYFPERLQFWWLADAIRRNRSIWKDCWVVEPCLQRNYWDRLQPLGIGAYAPNELGRAFTRIRRLKRDWIMTAALLWSKYTGPSPRDFDRACCRRKSIAPNLKGDTRFYLGYFPQIGVAKGSSLRLSEFDQNIFHALDIKRWLKPIDLLGKNYDLISFMGPGAGQMIPRRLYEWSTHSPANPAIEIKSLDCTTGEYSAFSCRLSEHGKRLREYGLESVVEAPPMVLGGCSAYTEKPVWVRWVNGTRSWIDALR